MANQRKAYANRLNHLRNIIINGVEDYALKNLPTVSANSIVVYHMEGNYGIAPLGALLASNTLPTSYSVIAVPHEDNENIYKVKHELNDMLENSEWGADNLSGLLDSAYSDALEAASGPLIDFDKPLYNIFGEVKLQRKDGQKDDGVVSITMRVNGSKLTYPVDKKTGEPVAPAMSIEHYKVSNEQFDADAPTVDDTESATNESDYRFEIPSFLSDFLKAQNISDKNVVVVKLK